MKHRIRDVYIVNEPHYPMTMVFDERGEQMPEFQDRKELVWDKIIAAADAETVFHGNLDWNEIRQGLKAINESLKD